MSDTAATATAATTPAAATEAAEAATEAAEVATGAAGVAAVGVAEAVEAVEAAGGGGSLLADGAIDIASATASAVYPTRPKPTPSPLASKAGNFAMLAMRGASYSISAFAGAAMAKFRKYLA